MTPSIAALGEEEHGAAALETAISFMLIFTCILGIIECCMMVYTYSVYADAARHGLRYATLHGFDSATCSGPTAGCSDPTASNVVSDVTTYAARYAAPASSVIVNVLYPDTSGCVAQSRVQVTISYVYQPIFHVPGTATSFQVSSQGRILY